MLFDFKDGKKYLSATVNENNTFTLSADRSKMLLTELEYYVYI